MSKDFLADREKALENQFFAKKNAELIDKLRADREAEAAGEAVAMVSGIRDADLLTHLTEIGLTPATWAAISLVPLVEVAWADGKVSAKERSAVLQAAGSQGIEDASPAAELLANWLDERPSREVLVTWGEYIVDLCERLGPESKRTLADELLGRARAVAETTGGILGLGNRVSEAEQKVLDVLAKAFA